MKISLPIRGCHNLRKFDLKILGLLFFTLSFGAWAQSATAPTAPSGNAKALSATISEFRDGSKIENYPKVLLSQFPEATEVKEVIFLPSEQGGSTLMGLVSRLLGEAPNSEFEGMRVRRYFYYLLGKDKKLSGVLHGSAAQTSSGPIDVFVKYAPEGNIQAVQVRDLPKSVEKEFADKQLLAQFVGRSPEDFAVERKGRKGRVKVIPAFLRGLKQPSSADSQYFFNKIIRSLRFNASFMDIAYFISQHPDLADQPTEGFPEEVEITTQQPTAGPEAYVREKASTNPFDGKVQILQGLPKN